MSANPKIKSKIPAKAKARAAQVNRMQRSTDEMGKFDNASATSVPMAIAALVGLGIEVVFYLFLFVFLLSDSTQIIYDYFYERGWVPYVLTYLASWSFAILFFKHRKLKSQQNVMQFKLLPVDISQDIRKIIHEFYAHIKKFGFDPTAKLSLTRILRGIEHFSVRKKPYRTADMQSQSEIDATMVDSSYVLIKVFIWAIPILGFIGTVLGISEAVSSFGGEMGAAADIEKIKEQLGQVTGGLSEAFDTTLVSLIFSLFVMFPTSVMQKNEEDLLNKVDEYCNEYFETTGAEPSHVIGHAGTISDQGDTIGRIENLQAYLLQLQESQTLVAQQMTEVANHYAQLVNPPTTPPNS